MRPDYVVVFPPFLDRDLSLLEAVNALAVEQFITEPGVEAYATTGFRGDPGSM